MTHTSMKNEILYVNGCSFAYGIGLSRDNENCIKQRFSASLSSKIEYLEMNVSVPGSSNSRIARRTVIDLMKYKPSIAIIIWSDPARFEFVQDAQRDYRHNEDCEQVRPLSVYSYPTHQKNAFLHYYSHISSSHRDVFNTLYEMLTVKITADSLGIPCIQIPFKGTFHREFTKVQSARNKSFLKTLEEFKELLCSDSNIYGMTEDISFDSISGCDLDPLLLSEIEDQKGHPNKEAHDIMSEWLYAKLQEKNIIK